MAEKNTAQGIRNKLIEVSGPLDTPCWIHAGRPGVNGYGYVSLDGKKRLIHIVVYNLLVGPVPDGLELDHLCRVPLCANPSHLEPVTHRENILRGIGIAAIHARKTHCIRGHEFTPDNTTVVGGGRRCRKCHNIRRRKFYAAQSPDEKKRNGRKISNGTG